MIHNQHDMQQQYWRQDIAVPRAGADFPDEEDEEDDELPGSGGNAGEGTVGGALPAELSTAGSRWANFQEKMAVHLPTATAFLENF